MMADPLASTTHSERKSLNIKTIGMIALPVVLLVGVIAIFLATNGAGLHVQPVVPAESLTFDRVVLHNGDIELHIRNTSPQDLSIAAININDAILPFEANPSAIVPHLGQTTLRVPYMWVRGESYEITLITANSIRFSTSIAAAAETAPVNTNTLLSFTLIGLYVGVIPVLLGVAWFPALK